MSATNLFQKRQRSDTSPDTPTAAPNAIRVRVELTDEHNSDPELDQAPTPITRGPDQVEDSGWDLDDSKWDPKKKTIPKQYWVQPPDQDTRPSHLAPVSSRARAQDKIQKRAIQGAAKRAQHAFKNAPLVRVGETLEALLSKTKKNTTNTLDNMRKLAEERLGDKEPLAFTTIYVDVNDQLLGVYLGYRWSDDPVREEGKYLTLETQYDGRTISDFKKGVEEGREYVSDGIPENLLIPYKYTVQYLVSQSQPTVPADVRHPENLEELENHLFRYVTCDGSRKVERKGVYHFAHAWKQQGHPSDPLSVSSDTVRNSSFRLSLEWYMEQSQPITGILAEYLNVFWPEVYHEFKKRFAAGRTIEGDSGPWIARALLYKMLLSMHYDQHDKDVTASFASGSSENAYMEVPELGALLYYCKGHAFMGHTDGLAHGLREWTPVADPEEEKYKVTPGRVATVFFFPKKTYDELEGKEEGWGRNCLLGRVPKATPS